MQDAFCFHKQFQPAGPSEFQTEQHYFLYAVAGTLRLEAQGRRWTLPPARAALIAAGYPITISVLSQLTSASVLFPTNVMAAPRAPLSVFDMTPLARALVHECRDWGIEAHPLPDYARNIFGTLAQVVTRLAENPSKCVLPAPKTPGLAKALALTEDQFDQDPTFDEIARHAGQSPRALARRFSDEMGMTWRQTLTRMRIIRAIELLATSEVSVTEIAHAVGFQSLSGFNAAFRELTDMTPTRYRASFALAAS